MREARVRTSYSSFEFASLVGGTNEEHRRMSVLCRSYTWCSWRSMKKDRGWGSNQYRNVSLEQSSYRPAAWRYPSLQQRDGSPKPPSCHPDSMRSDGRFFRAKMKNKQRSYRCRARGGHTTNENKQSPSTVSHYSLAFHFIRFLFAEMRFQADVRVVFYYCSISLATTTRNLVVPGVSVSRKQEPDYIKWKRYLLESVYVWPVVVSSNLDILSSVSSTVKQLHDISGSEWKNSSKENLM